MTIEYNTTIQWDWMACSSIIYDTDLTGTPQLGMPIVIAPNSPYAENSTPIYRGLLVDVYGVGIPAAAVSVLTLTIADTLTGTIINSCNQANILNTGRGTLDSSGNLQILFEAADMSLSESPGVAQLQRSAIIDWTYATSGPTPPASTGQGRHQVNFIVQALAGP